ncbi:WXG100 family type VII secretion target [Intestinibacillus sp. Marseille-P6563]|uniref:WXG100 family type VII secretion target n=1 Tax=Intestinibacillus sp. Marseille-P6563 TaxID=2364792 RepID=UPI000F05D388|nr:WXG100 family type VII secretion target [Intestinibacillus sp. Marseille-P6563]
MKYRINYSKVISQANSVAGNASELSTQIRLLEQMEQDCRSAWKGQAADAFITKLRTLRTEMSRTKSQMSTLASTIKYCADRIQREDRRAEERAAALNSGH